jgi:hypothetical protein
MDIDRVLAGLPDDESIPQMPRGDNLVALDDAFESADYCLGEAEATFSKRSSADDSETILMHLPAGKRVTLSKSQIRACRNDAELRELDRSLYRAAGLDPTRFGL